MAGIYIHIPFCRQACHYCDFHFSTNQSGKAELVQLIEKELILQKEYLGGEAVETIYFGGGTPSLLIKEELTALLQTIHLNFAVATAPEVTLEANPDDLSDENLEVLRGAGVNRLSLGIQSFDDTVLRFFNRAHNAAEALSCIRRARAAGFNNLSADLIYSVPGQTDEMLRHNLALLLQEKPEHISAYSLTIEEKTVFGKKAKKGELHAMGDEQSAAQFEIVMDTLIAAGYRHYEISNFCLPGYQSKHNTSYWQQKKYLGVGPSAHSFDGTSRQYTISNNHTYSRALKEGTIPYEKEVLTKENKINEYIFTSLRTDTGCDVHFLKSQHGYDLVKTNERYLSQLLDKKNATLADGILILTRQGKLLTDQIASDLFITG